MDLLQGNSTYKQVSYECKEKNVYIENEHIALYCNLGSGRFDMSCKDRGGVKLQGASPAVRINGVWHSYAGIPVISFDHKTVEDGVGSGIEFRFHYRTVSGLPGTHFVIRIYRGIPSAFFRLVLKNNESVPVAIGKVQVLQMKRSAGGCLELGQGLEKAKIYLESNNMYWTGVRDLFSDEPFRQVAYVADALENNMVDIADIRVNPDKPLGQHESGGVGLIWNQASKTAFLSGFITAELALTKCVVNVERPEDISSWYMSCAYDELKIDPGNELSTEELCVGFYSDPFESLEAYGGLLEAGYHIGPMKDTPLLWCSWYSHRMTVDEGAALENARIIAQRYKKYGVDTVQLDYGWNRRDTPGEWKNHRERFPHGMKWLSERLGEMGLKLGVWLAPFYIGEQSKLYREHPEILLRNPADGKPVKLTWEWNGQDKDTRQSVYLMDTTQPYAQQWLKELFREMSSWGIRYFKLDFLNGGSEAPLSFTKPGASGSFRLRDGEQARRGLTAIREGAGKDAYIVVCNFPITHGIGIISAAFAAMDVGNATGCFEHLKSRMTTLISRYYQQKKIWHNDPDVINLSGRFLERGEVCSQGEARIRLTAIGLCGGPVLLGDDLPTMPEEQLQMNTLCLPAYGESAKPIDLFTNDHPRIWDMKVRTDWGGWHVTGLFNYDAKDALILVLFEELGLDRDCDYLVWEFWAQEFLGVLRDKAEVRVEKESAKTLLIRKAESRPQILSTTFHIGQGAVEISNTAWNESKMTLSGKIERHAGAKGSIFFHVPSPRYKVHAFEAHGAKAGGRTISDCIYSIDLEFEQDQANWEIKFSEIL